MTLTARQEYAAALKEGQKEYARLKSLNKDPELAVLEELLPDMGKLPVQELPSQEIPMDRIVGTVTRGRISALTAGFLPLLEENSEFAQKWAALCDASLSETGLRDPILCYEYLGSFYVQEGNKRVSVLKHFGNTRILSDIRRLLPERSDDPRIRAYYEFVDFHRLTGSYEIQFQKPGEYARLLAALGKKPGEVWSEEERRRFSARYAYFKEAFAALGGGSQDMNCADALLLWLRVYPYEELSARTARELKESLSGLWQDVQVTGDQSSLQVSTAPTEEQQSLLTKLISPAPKRLNVAMIYQQDEEISTWTRGHVQGAASLREALPEQVTVREYRHADTPEETLRLLDLAAEEGADLIFTTTPLLLGATLKAAVQHPRIRYLNCSASTSLSSVRSYYCRIYEGKFITGAIAGAMARDDRIGYVANYPIMGVTASINAFALGARMTNPRAKIILKWSCLPGNPILELKEAGVSVISNRDEDSGSHSSWDLGTYMVTPEHTLQPLASPRWNWGSYYEKTVRSLLSGGIEVLRDSKHAINDWWGIDSGVVNIDIGKGLPEGVKQLGRILKTDILEERLDPFLCPIRDQNGRQISDGARVFTPDELMKINWLNDNIEGSIPTFDELLPRSQNLVRLLGIYRDTIPPKTEEETAL